MLDRTTRRWSVAASLASLLASACGVTGGDPVPVIASFAVDPPSIVLGATATLSWSVTDATSLTIDQGVGMVAGSSVAVVPAATTTYTLTATGPGGSAARTARVTVTTPPSVLEPACSGASCGAVSGTLYSGTGIGIWRYRNTTGMTRTIDIRIGGVSSGSQAALVFSNGTGGGIAPLPSAGTLAFPPMSSLRLEPSMDADPVDQAGEHWHRGLLEENRRIGLALRAARRVGASAPRTALASPALPTPAVGDSRTWNEASVSPAVVYDTVARDVCDLPGGRKAVFWVDPRSTTSASLTAEDLAYFKTTFCGPAGAAADGGFGRVRDLMGDVWGVVDPVLASEVISDTPFLQDVNVVFLEVPTGTAPKVWAGYFWGGNNIRRSTGAYASSNEALAFFIDATQVHANSSSRGYFGSVLLHELTHMANFYQRAVSRGTPNDTWLEETTATMTDDIVTPAATPDHVSIIPGQRILPYVRSGGAISFIGWDYPEQNSYAVAGAFGAFVDRRYGTSILSGTIGCAVTGIDCLDQLIVAGGGTSFADEFARVGASIFGLLPLAGTPDGYGYPAKISGSYTLAAIDVAAYAASRKATATSLGLEFPAGSHTYQLDTVAPGHAVYTRTGVVVPHGTSIMLVIQQGAR